MSTQPTAKPNARKKWNPCSPTKKGGRTGKREERIEDVPIGASRRAGCGCALLVSAARAGDRSAFGQLYRQFTPLVRAIVIRRLGVDGAQDVVHDVFLEALQALTSLESPASFPAWIATMARNRAVDCLRSRARSRHLVPIREFSGIDNSLERAAVLAMIRALPPAYAQTLWLRFIEGMTGPEIAVRMGMTSASVRVNLWRGMRLLRQKLDPAGQE